MNCYDLTLELIRVMGDIDRNLDEKSKYTNPADIKRVDRDIDRLEVRMFEIKKILKSKDI